MAPWTHDHDGPAPTRAPDLDRSCCGSADALRPQPCGGLLPGGSDADGGGRPLAGHGRHPRRRRARRRQPARLLPRVRLDHLDRPGDAVVLLRGRLRLGDLPPVGGAQGDPAGGLDRHPAAPNGHPRSGARRLLGRRSSARRAAGRVRSRRVRCGRRGDPALVPGELHDRHRARRRSPSAGSGPARPCSSGRSSPCSRSARSPGSRASRSSRRSTGSSAGSGSRSPGSPGRRASCPLDGRSPVSPPSSGCSPWPRSTSAPGPR